MKKEIEKNKISCEFCLEKFENKDTLEEHNKTCWKQKELLEQFIKGGIEINIISVNSNFRRYE